MLSYPLLFLSSDFVHPEKALIEEKPPCFRGFFMFRTNTVIALVCFCNENVILTNARDDWYISWRLNELKFMQTVIL